MKNQVKILISGNKQTTTKKRQRELFQLQGPREDGMNTSECHVDYSSVALSFGIRVGACVTSALPTYQHCKSLFSTGLSSQLPSAFQEVEGPKEPVTVLFRAKNVLFRALSASPLPVICANFAHVKHK